MMTKQPDKDAAASIFHSCNQTFKFQITLVFKLVDSTHGQSDMRKRFALGFSHGW